MNVNALNSMTSMQKITSAPAFKACSCDKEVSKPAQKQNLSGLEALAAMLTPHKHYVQDKNRSSQPDIFLIAPRKSRRPCPYC